MYVVYSSQCHVCSIDLCVYTASTTRLHKYLDNLFCVLGDNNFSGGSLLFERANASTSAAAKSAAAELQVLPVPWSAAPWLPVRVSASVLPGASARALVRGAPRALLPAERVPAPQGLPASRLQAVPHGGALGDTVLPGEPARPLPPAAAASQSRRNEPTGPAGRYPQMTGRWEGSCFGFCLGGDREPCVGVERLPTKPERSASSAGGDVPAASNTRRALPASTSLLPWVWPGSTIVL